MTRKDYEAVARQVRYLMNGHAHDYGTRVGAAQVATLRALVQGLADTFAEDNPRFCRDKFYEACHFYEHNLRQVANIEKAKESLRESVA